MKVRIIAYLCLTLIVLSIPLISAEEIAYLDESGAGIIGPEHRFLYAFDRVGDNIAMFLSRIGGEENHANSVRRVIAERRAEHHRLIRLKNEGSISNDRYQKGVSTVGKSMKSNEDKLRKAETRIAESRRLNK